MHQKECAALPKQPTPRKGTETRLCVPVFAPDRNNPHPARGRKLPDPGSRIFCHRNNPHPARGRKPCTLPLCSFAARNNPHPARGRKPAAALPARPDIETTHTPQGDGNLHPAGKPINHSKQPTPRKGTETPRRYGTGCKSARKQPTPRKGTETTFSRPLDCPFQETTHTPQGDGNSRGMILTVPISETTHTPQGDGNSLLFQNVWIVTETTPTPQGDGNISSSKLSSHSTRNNPHPARGRKPVRAFRLSKFKETTHTPQGDGNTEQQQNQRFVAETTHTPQGGGN